MITIPSLKQHLSSSEPKWFAIYVRYRSEKMVLQNLQQKGVQAYLPLNRLLRRNGKSKKWVELPLISNYVFVKITTKEYVRVLETNHVLNFVKIARQLIPIPEKEINILKKVTGEHNLELEVDNQGFEKGDWVEISTGRLAGIKGRLSEIQGKKKLVVTLDGIGYFLKIKVSASQVSKIKQPKTQGLH